MLLNSMVVEEVICTVEEEVVEETNMTGEVDLILVMLAERVGVVLRIRETKQFLSFVC